MPVWVRTCLVRRLLTTEGVRDLAVLDALPATCGVRHVLQWIKNGEWLRRAGSFEVDPAAASTLDDQVDFWQGEAEATGLNSMSCASDWRKPTRWSGSSTRK
jgi:hypothetical protein